MKIIKYRTELDENKHNVLVKENSFDFPVDSLNAPQSITEMLNTVFRLNRQAEEYVYMIALNTKGKSLGVFELSHGTVNLSICSTRDIFIKALLCGASGIVLAHNHTSGDTTPSKEDIEIYNKVKKAGKLLDIRLFDNIIAGDNYFSFAENE